MKERTTLVEGDIFLLTPPLKSDPYYVCRLVYLSYDIKGLCAYILSKEPVETEEIDLETIEYNTSRVIYASIHFMKSGLWKKLGHSPLSEIEDALTLRNVGAKHLMKKDRTVPLKVKDHMAEYPFQPVYDLLEVFAVIYGKHYKKDDHRCLAWAKGEIAERLD